MSTFDSSVSGYLTSDFEGISMTFTEVTPLPSSGYCKIYKAQRYGRWFFLKCLSPEHRDDPAYQQMPQPRFHEVSPV